MTASRAPSVSNVDLRRALRWSAVSVAWTLFSSTATISAGIVAGSVLLVAFGAVGTTDLIGSLVLIGHFRHALRHEAINEDRERRALLVIAVAMGAIAAGTLVVSIVHLGHHDEASSSAFGTAVAGVSIAALGTLSFGKSRIGRVINSRALVADAHLSAIGAVLATIACVGTIATSAFDWWWLDAVASIAVALVAATVAIDHARHA